MFRSCKLATNANIPTDLLHRYNPIDDKNRYIDAFNTGTILTAMTAMDLIGGIQFLRMPNFSQIFKVATPLEVTGCI